MRFRWRHVFAITLLGVLAATGQDDGAGRLSGRVVDQGSESCAGASVMLISLNQSFGTKTDSNGAFDFKGVEEGEYVLEVDASGFVKKSAPITLGAGQSKENISVVLKIGNMPDMERCGREVSIRYQSADPGKPKLPGSLRDYFTHKPAGEVKVRVVSETKRQRPIMIYSNRFGRFSVTNLAPDYYDIQMSSSDYEKDELKHVAIPRENEVLVGSTLTKRGQGIICQ